MKDFAKMIRKQLVAECRLLADEQKEYEKTIDALKKSLAEAQPPVKEELQVTRT